MRVAGYQRNIKASFIPGQIKSFFLVNEWQEEVDAKRAPRSYLTLAPATVAPALISYTYRIPKNNPGTKIMASPNPKPNLKLDCNPNNYPFTFSKKKTGTILAGANSRPPPLYAYSVIRVFSDEECGAQLFLYRFIFSSKFLEEVYLAMCERGLTPPNQARTSNVTCLRRLGGAAIGVT